MQRHWGKLVVGALIVILLVAGAFGAMRWFGPSASTRQPNLVQIPPLAPVSRSSQIVLPAAIAMTAIRDAMERAPRELSGKPELPFGPPGSNMELIYQVTRGGFAVAGRPEGLALSTSLNGSLRLTGQFGPPGGGFGPPGGFGGPGGFPGPPPGFGPPGGLFGGNQGQSAQNESDRRIDVRGNLELTARPELLPGWRVAPNLVSQVTIGDASISILGMTINLSNEMKPTLERTINEQVSSLQKQLADSSMVEEAAKKQWAQMCRSISLGATAPGAPNLWLELRPTRAFAAQPRIDQSAVTLTFGVQAETRIVPTETKPDCPFPAQLELVQQMEQGQFNLALPVDIPFTEISRVMEAQLKGKVFPEDRSGSFTATIQSVNVAASGDRLLISLGVKANETKSWFGFGASAVIHVWGRPALDRERQMLRINNIQVDIDSEAAFGLLGMAARAAVPYLEKSLADNSTVDLAQFATNARRSIDAAIADFQRTASGVRVDATATDLRLVGLEFDSKVLRIIGEADGTVRVTVTALPAQ
jgi:hypothetical protein